MNEKDNKTTVSVGRNELSMLNRISLYSCQTGTSIINSLIESLYEHVKKHFAAIEQNGEILTFFPEWHSGYGIDQVSGVMQVPFDPDENEEKEIIALRDNMINAEFKKIDKLKETRRKLFAAKRTPTQSETPISDALSTVFSDASTIPEVT